MKGLPILAAACLLAASPLRAQELNSQPTPFTAWLDFHPRSGANLQPRTLPIWLEKVETHAEQKADGSGIEKTTVRLRFRRFAGINDEMLLRLFFDGSAKPTVSAWSEIGACVIAPRRLGEGLAVPVSETLVMPMAGTDYIDIETPGDGAGLQGAFLSSLQKSETRTALDFASAPALTDPFANQPPAQPGASDALLFGRVKATLESGAVALTAENGGSSVFSFDLATVPLIAVVTFEIANADVSSPPEIIVNEHGLGRAAIHLPDLADPAFTGDVQPSDVTFHYTGWLPCQKVIPGSALLAGANALQISSRSGAVAIRAVEVQLKYSSGPTAP